MSIALRRHFLFKWINFSSMLLPVREERLARREDREHWSMFAHRTPVRFL